MLSPAASAGWGSFRAAPHVRPLHLPPHLRVRQPFLSHTHFLYLYLSRARSLPVAFSLARSLFLTRSRSLSRMHFLYTSLLVFGCVSSLSLCRSGALSLPLACSLSLSLSFSLPRSLSLAWTVAGPPLSSLHVVVYLTHVVVYLMHVAIYLTCVVVYLTHVVVYIWQVLPSAGPPHNLRVLRAHRARPRLCPGPDPGSW